jgi:hypothetical protein
MAMRWSFSLRRSDWWARTVSNRRPLVCKAAAKHPHSLVGLPRCRYVQVMSPRYVAASTASRLVVARLGTLWAHRGVVSPRASKIDYDLAALVNSVYALAEDGLCADSTPRTTPARMAELIAAGYIAVARADERIIGVVQIQRLDTGKGEFGMLVADPAHHGQGRRPRARPVRRALESRAGLRHDAARGPWCRGSGLIRARSS